MNFQSSDMKKTRYLNSWKGGAWTLLLIAAFSVINILIYAFGSDSYFLFSAFLPYSIGLWGVDYLLGWYGAPVNVGAGIFFLSISAVIVIVYGILCFFGRKKVGFLIAGLVLFSLDTVYMLYIMIMSGDVTAFIGDCIFHGVGILEIAVGIDAALKYKKLPEELPVPFEDRSETEGTISAEETSGISEESR